MKSARKQRTDADSYLRRRYGLTIEEKERILISQNNLCVIGNHPFKDKRDMCIDHDHKTGKIRQILCANHNWACGFLHDSPKEAIELAQYLIKWGK